MAWNAAFPTGNTQVNQSVQQIQDNWAFVETTIGTDHFFNTGAPTEGHHKYAQLVDQAGDPALAVTGGVLYTKSGGSTIQPYFRNATNIRQIPTFFRGQTPVGGGGGTYSITNLAGQQAFLGFLTTYQVGGMPSANGSAFVAWDGTAGLTVVRITASGQITNFSTLAGTSIGVTSSSAQTLQWYILAFYNEGT